MRPLSPAQQNLPRAAPTACHAHRETLSGRPAPLDRLARVAHQAPAALVLVAVQSRARSIRPRDAARQTPPVNGSPHPAEISRGEHVGSGDPARGTTTVQPPRAPAAAIRRVIRFWPLDDAEWSRDPEHAQRESTVVRRLALELCARRVEAYDAFCALVLEAELCERE